MSYNYKTISFIIPTIGRPSLKKALASIKEWPGDEVIVVQHDPPSGNWGNTERREAIAKAKCDYLAFIDDDDVYVPGAREMMDLAIRENPGENPILFRMRYPSGRVIWRKRWVKNGNVGSPMILVPNKKDKLPEWDLKHRWADFKFINEWKWPAKSIMWRGEIIALIGHDDEKYESGMSYQEWRNRMIKAGKQ